MPQLLITATKGTTLKKPVRLSPSLPVAKKTIARNARPTRNPVTEKYVVNSRS